MRPERTSPRHIANIMQRVAAIAEGVAKRG
jgi:hypothetical protein